MAWLVVYTKSQKETLAHDHLERQGFLAYCPMHKKEIKYKSKTKIMSLPLFPRYLFIQANEIALKKIHLIRSTVGVSSLILRDGKPIYIKDEILDAIRIAEKGHLGQVETFFNAGDRVIINEGIYKDIEAIYQNNDGLERAVLLLNILQKNTQLTIETRHIRKA